MPRALTEQEKIRQIELLLEKGKDIVFEQGIRKISVDDITRAAGVAKGTFYQHFESKEQFLYKLIINVHCQMFIQAEQVISGQKDIATGFRSFITNCFHMPELAFLIKNEREIESVLVSMPDQDFKTFKRTETGVFEKLLDMAHIDPQKVKPGVVHNYIHTLYLDRKSVV